MALLPKSVLGVIVSLSGVRNGQEIGKTLNTVLIDAELERTNPSQISLLQRRI
jgi:hypothetical protein